MDSEHCSQRWVPQVVQYTTAIWLSFSSQQTDNSRSRSKKVWEKLVESKLFPDFCSEAYNLSINSINAKFFFKSQTPFGPISIKRQVWKLIFGLFPALNTSFIWWNTTLGIDYKPKSVGCRSKGQKMMFSVALELGNRNKHEWQRVWPQNRRRGVLSPCIPKMLSQTLHSNTYIYIRLIR